jgi:hypothetical protein
MHRIDQLISLIVGVLLAGMACPLAAFCDAERRELKIDIIEALPTPRSVFNFSLSDASHRFDHGSVSFSDSQLAAFSHMDFQEIKGLFDHLENYRLWTLKAFYTETALYYDRLAEQLLGRTDHLQYLPWNQLESMPHNARIAWEEERRKSVDKAVYDLKMRAQRNRRDSQGQRLLNIEKQLSTQVLSTGYELYHERIQGAMKHSTEWIREHITESGVHIDESNGDLQAVIILPEKKRAPSVTRKTY